MADEMEQQLREKIASQRTALAELPSLKSIVDETGLTSPETKARAQQIKELSDNEEELELLLESKRVEAVVSFKTSYILLKTLRIAPYVLKQSNM